MTDSRVTIHLEGAMTAVESLKELEFAARRRVVSAAVRASNAEIVRVAKKLAPFRTGNLQKQIRGTVKMDRVSGRVFGYVRARANKAQKAKGTKNAARYVHLVVGGTRAHSIQKGDEGAMLKLPGGWFTRVEHPGAKPRPFIEQAASSAFNDAVRAFDFKFQERMIVEINKVATKNASKQAALDVIRARF